MIKHTRDEVVSASLAYFGGDQLAADAFTKKYALRDLEKNFYELTPADSHHRIAGELSRIESRYPNPVPYETILRMLLDWEFSVQGGPLSGIGNRFQIQSLSNCFVVDAAHDSYGGIFLTDQEQAQIMKRRGGVGHDVSNLRPRDMHVANAAETTDGLGVFMERYSNTTREVAQKGRRGALMLTVSVHHPEIETFIEIKRDLKRVTGANISIRATDEFMRAVRDGTTYNQRFPVDAAPADRLVDREVGARAVWQKMMEAAWDSAEPGILFWDTIIRNSPADCYWHLGYRTISTNPCGELPLSAYDSCRLAFLNLVKFVVDPFLPTARFDFVRFRQAVEIGQRLMDDIVDLESEAIDRILEKVESDPEPEAVKLVERELWNKIRKATLGGRRTGLGLTAVGDMLAMVGLRYGSPEGTEFTERVYRELALGSYSSSIRMAAERGAFPVFDLSCEEDHVFVSRVVGELEPELQRLYRTRGRRNIACNTTAPVGTLSTLVRTSSGIEPVIFLSSKRRRKINPDEAGVRVDFVDQSGDSWQEYVMDHPGVDHWKRVTGETDVSKSPYWGATAEKIDWVSKVDMQAAAQRWIDHSISNTTNMPDSATVEDVSAVYMRGWETGCKGITIYRAGSRTGVILDAGKQDERKRKLADTSAPARPAELPCHIHRATIKGEQYVIIVGMMDGRPYELFAGLASRFEDLGRRVTSGTVTKHARQGAARYSLAADGCQVDDIVGTFDNPNHGALTRMLSTSLRHGVPVRYVVEQLRKDKSSDLWSFSTVIARVFAKNYVADGIQGKSCPECKEGKLIYQEGCPTCNSCTYGKCS